MKRLYVGIDTGGSHIEGVLVDDKLNVLRSERIWTIGKKKKKTFLGEFRNLLEELCRDEKIAGLGIGVPGPVRDGVMFWSCNSTFMEDTDFTKLAGKKYGKVVVDNDVNCMAFGETVTRKERNIIALTLGTGVGGGIVIDGKLHNTRPYAGEVGHMVMDPTGVKCTCGSRGCFQEYVGKRGVDRLYKKYFRDEFSPQELSTLAGKGDAHARKVWEEYGKLLGLGLANLSNILDPELIVLGGGISGAFRYFEKSMKREMKSRLHMKPPKVVKGRENAVAFGAACMVLRS